MKVPPSHSQFLVPPDYRLTNDLQVLPIPVPPPKSDQTKKNKIRRTLEIDVRVKTYDLVSCRLELQSIQNE